MTNLFNHQFAPWTVEGGKRIVADEFSWEFLNTLDRAESAFGVPCRVEVLGDVFAPWEHTLFGSHDKPLVHANGRWELEQTEQHESCSGVTIADIRNQLFRAIDATPNLTYVLTTEFPERVLGMWPRIEPTKKPLLVGNLDGWRNNIILSVHVRTQADADRLIPQLLKCADLVPTLLVRVTPREKIRFTLRDIPDWDEDWKYNTLTGHEFYSPRDDSEPSSPHLNWVVVEGDDEPLSPEHVRSIRDQCQAAGVPWWFESWGEWLHESQFPEYPWGPQASRLFNHGADGTTSFSFRVGRDKSGCLLDGKSRKELPEVKR